MEDVKVEIETIEVKSEKSVIRFTDRQIEDIIRSYIQRKKKLPADVEFNFIGPNGDFIDLSGCSIQWKKEQSIKSVKKPGEKKSNTPDPTLAGLKV